MSARKVTTIEGVTGKVAQAAWQQLDGVQCGYCQSGQIMSATGKQLRSLPFDFYQLRGA